MEVDNPVKLMFSWVSSVHVSCPLSQFSLYGALLWQWNISVLPVVIYFIEVSNDSEVNGITLLQGQIADKNLIYLLKTSSV